MSEARLGTIEFRGEHRTRTAGFTGVFLVQIHRGLIFKINFSRSSLRLLTAFHNSIPGIVYLGSVLKAVSLDWYGT